MHEISVVQGLIRIVLDTCTEHNQNNPERQITKILEIKCEAGLLAGFDLQTLKECFEIFSDNTLCAGADLIVTTAPLSCQCSNCNNKFILFERNFKCPKCGSPQINFQGGNGLIMQALNVECED